MARLPALPRRAVVLVEDETCLHLLPHVRASWTRRGARLQVPTPGKNRQVTVFGGDQGHRRHPDLPAGPPLRRRLHCLPGPAAPGVPRAPAIVVICDNGSIHHARAVSVWLEEQARLDVAGHDVVDRVFAVEGRMRPTLSTSNSTGKPIDRDRGLLQGPYGVRAAKNSCGPFKLVGLSGSWWAWAYQARSPGVGQAMSSIPSQGAVATALGVVCARALTWRCRCDWSA